MDIDRAFQRLREVNPVPGPSFVRVDLDAGRFLTSTRERSHEMETVELTERRQGTLRRRRAVLSVAGAAIAIVVGFLAFSVGGEREATSEARSLLESFVSAWDQQDVVRAVALFTEDAVFDPGTGSCCPVATGRAEIEELFREVMPMFRFVEAYDLEAAGDGFRFNTRLVSRDGTEEECQRSELTLQNGRIHAWKVTVLSFSPCP